MGYVSTKSFSGRSAAWVMAYLVLVLIIICFVASLLNIEDEIRNARRPAVPSHNFCVSGIPCIQLFKKACCTDKVVSRLTTSDVGILENYKSVEIYPSIQKSTLWLV